ncbi:MAG: type III-B CRISPR module RAMP protein Cmr4 [Actinomycetota bacterium]|jgi:CRISPR-associated protein Cmr4|nr:type III-B CRISPR module RAMP protein Cmr4 [Actinomycetota bacterium]
MASYKKFLQVGLALDPIHAGTGGARIVRVDLTIVRDPVTQLPKIPGSSLAGVYRTYVAMAETEANPNRQVNGKAWPYYPHCAGLGQARDNYLGHCGQPDCPVCTVFGFARGKDQAGGFAGLAAFTDAHVLLFPVPTRQGPHWVTCPMVLQWVGLEVKDVEKDAVYRQDASGNPLNLGWLLLPVCQCAEMSNIKERLQGLKVPDYILNHLALVPDRLFAHIVNSNLEVRTSVSIDPTTGAAEERALFSYEALPRTTVLAWEIIAKNPAHFNISGQQITAVSDPQSVHGVAAQAHLYLEHLGIGGMGTRGMGRLRVVYSEQSPSNRQPGSGQTTSSISQGGGQS